MKTLLILIVIASFASCASKPKEQEPMFFTDEYGLPHRAEEALSPFDIASVNVTYGDIPIGCKRLRDIYLKSNDQLDFKVEGAKMFATDVQMLGDVLMKGDYVHTAVGVGYNCRNMTHFRSQLELQKAYMQRAAMQELERRRSIAGEGYKLKEIKEGAFNKGGQLVKFKDLSSKTKE